MYGTFTHLDVSAQNTHKHCTCGFTRAVIATTQASMCEVIRLAGVCKASKYCKLSLSIYSATLFLSSTTFCCPTQSHLFIVSYLTLLTLSYLSKPNIKS